MAQGLVAGGCAYRSPATDSRARCCSSVAGRAQAKFLSMPTHTDLKPPTAGEAITMSGGKLSVPTQPVIPFIEGDGTGPDIWRASQFVFDAAVKKAYGGKRRIEWFEVLDRVVLFEHQPGQCRKEAPRVAGLHHQRRPVADLDAHHVLQPHELPGQRARAVRVDPH